MILSNKKINNIHSYITCLFYGYLITILILMILFIKKHRQHKFLILFLVMIILYLSSKKLIGYKKQLEKYSQNSEELEKKLIDNINKQEQKLNLSNATVFSFSIFLFHTKDKNLDKVRQTLLLALIFGIAIPKIIYIEPEYKYSIQKLITYDFIEYVSQLISVSLLIKSLCSSYLFYKK